MPTLIRDAVGMWTAHLRAAGLAANTVERHRYAVAGSRTGLLSVIEKNKGYNATMGQIDQGVIDKYFAAFTGSSGQRANKIESVKKFLSWSENRGLLRPGMTTAKLMDGYKAKRGQRKPKHYIEPQDFGAFLAAAADADGTTGPRDRAVAAIALYTLARASEIGSLDMAHVEFDRRNLGIYRHKLKRWTDSPLTAELEFEIVAWLRVYAEQTGYDDFRVMMDEHPDWLVVPSIKVSNFSGKWWPVTDAPIPHMEQIVKGALVKMGVNETLGEGVHTIRRSGARALFKRLMDVGGYDSALTFVQSMLDHEDPKMTLKYIGMDWVKSQLNDWLLNNSMYGTPVSVPGNVTQLRRAM